MDPQAAISEFSPQQADTASNSMVPLTIPLASGVLLPMEDTVTTPWDSVTESTHTALDMADMAPVTSMAPQASEQAALDPVTSVPAVPNASRPWPAALAVPALVHPVHHLAAAGRDSWTSKWNQPHV